ncbi:hypothetical protein ACD591_16370 [Rufibacter glacialis]|uniref:Uncharacterized protein n=1 Tax=Rufibacter glacialis TaxID=1259555 RepID=A0A5M8QSL6_9BACT|nr:hypothetical protein [Rufibacter glacialis]KAA6437483.1 hypothetical protein FOE74_02990 [Rufibacter glacialis]GGK58992.1 hypothetical protein GCM10011405_03790 [Rufibacter glacialis]
MARHGSSPILYDDVKKVSVSDLKKWGYLEPESFKTGTVTWSRQGRKTGSISITVNICTGCYLELDYGKGGKSISYRVNLVTLPSNLGKGELWYFVCPQTGKRCRFLYLVGDRFLHREAYGGCMYETQTYSKYGRKLDKYFAREFGHDKLYEQLYSRHFRTMYAGKPTKKYLSIMRKLGASDQELIVV